MKKAIILFALVLALGTQSVSAYFSDVPTNTERSTYINWLQDQGVVQGYGDGSFGIEKEINRAEFLKMLYETTGGIDVNNFPKTSPFADISRTDWYYSYVVQAYMDGVVQGYQDGSFKPGNNITLAEALKIVEEGFISDENIQYQCNSEDVNIFSACGKAIPDTDALTGCKRITKTDWAYKYFWLN